MYSFFEVSVQGTRIYTRQDSPRSKKKKILYPVVISTVLMYYYLSEQVELRSLQVQY